MSPSQSSNTALVSASSGGHTRNIDGARLDSIDRSSGQMPARDQLSSQDFVELTRISRKKKDIEQHIANLQSWPAWDPFKDVSTYSTDLDSLDRSRATLDAISDNLNSRKNECSRLERDVETFNLEDMKRLRSVAKAVSKRHLSGPDTDLLELALETVFALDKLLRLLREHRQEHELTDLRLQWERLICAGWADVRDLRCDIEAFEHKCNFLASSQPNARTSLSAEGMQCYTQGAEAIAMDVQHELTKQRLPRSISSSSRLAMESLKLESSRLIIRIRSFDTERARPAGKLLDLLIDQRQVPERLIDEQEKLEDALPPPSVIETKASQTLSLLGESSTLTPHDHDPGRSTSAETQSKDLIRAVELKAADLSSSRSMLIENLPVPQDQSLGLGSRIHPHRGSSSSLHATPARHTSNRYRSNPRDELDVAIGDIVNRMPISVSIRNASLADSAFSARPFMSQTLSGQYWIGDPEPRLCFCRILPSRMVMIRVGGGWQELSEFLVQHYAHLGLQGSQNHATIGRQPSSLVFMRSASGPVGSPRLRTRCSVGSLQSYSATHNGAPQKSSRIVTMPPMKTISATTPAKKSTTQSIAVSPPRQVPLESRDFSFSTPDKNSDLPSSSSTSSIIIHGSPTSSSFG